MFEIRNITFDANDPEKLAQFWAAVTGWQIEAAAPEEVTVSRGRGTFPRLLFMRVTEGKRTKNRVHLDLQAKALAADVARLRELGAREGVSYARDGFRWTILYDPEGNELCIVAPPEVTE
jgi:hypothetical protein